MKRIIVLLFISIVCVGIYSQNLKFDGVPLGIGIEEFIPMVEKKGYIYNESISANSKESRNMYYFDGMLAGENVCLSVRTTPISRLVFNITVSFGDYSTEKDGVTVAQINTKFNKIKNGLTNKYPKADRINESNKEYPSIFILNSDKWYIMLYTKKEDGYVSLYSLYLDKDMEDKTNEEESL